jgi:hypothetical protein
MGGRQGVLSEKHDDSKPRDEKECEADIKKVKTI